MTKLLYNSNNMKKFLLLTLAAMLVAGCEKPVFGDVEDVDIDETPSKQFTFTVKGDFNAATFKGPRRTYLQADGQSMTDLWVFDYVNGNCVQSLHQVAEDEDFGRPTMSLSYGTHHVYFVASRGAEPAIDMDTHIITWTTVRDTFWKDYEVEVVQTSNGNRAVTLDRVVTKLRVAPTDEVPASIASLSVTPDTWYYGLDFVAGTPTNGQKKEISVNVPDSYIGTTGELSLSVFGMSGADEWTTDVAVQAKDGTGAVIGSASITGAPFKANRSTEYSGNLFGSSGGLDVSVNENWENPKIGNW